MPDRPDPWRVRFRVPMTVFPPLVGVVAVALGESREGEGETHPDRDEDTQYADDRPGPARAAIVAGSLSTGIAAFAVQALFGTPGVRGDEPDEPASRRAP